MYFSTLIITLLRRSPKYLIFEVELRLLCVRTRYKIDATKIYHIVNAYIKETNNRTVIEKISLNSIYNKPSFNLPCVDLSKQYDQKMKLNLTGFYLAARRQGQRLEIVSVDVIRRLRHSNYYAQLIFFLVETLNPNLELWLSSPNYQVSIRRQQYM